MTSNPKSTWWKRLFTVLEIGFVALGVAGFAWLYFWPMYEKPPVYDLAIWMIPAVLVWILRVAVTYVVEGGKR